MLESPRGWLVFLLRVQRTNHADGVVLVGPLNTQAVLYIVIVV